MLYGRHRRREAGRDLSGCSLGEDIIGLGCQFSAAGLHLLGNHALAGGGGDTPEGTRAAPSPHHRAEARLEGVKARADETQWAELCPSE